MLSSSPTQGPTNSPSASRSKLAILLATVLSVAGCQDGAENNTVQDREDEPASVATTSTASASDKAVADRDTQARCEDPFYAARDLIAKAMRCKDYPHPLCDTKTGLPETPNSKTAKKTVREDDSLCFVPNNAETQKRTTTPRSLYEALHAPAEVDQRAAYKKAYKRLAIGALYEECIPHELNSNPRLHQLMRARILSQNPDMITQYGVVNEVYLNADISNFGEKGMQVFGSLQDDFVEIQTKCKDWDADSKRRLLPKVCLLALDKKVIKEEPKKKDK